jgi:hypothetical protein
MPATPRKCIGKKVKLTPIKNTQKCNCAKNSEYFKPVIL